MIVRFVDEVGEKVVRVVADVDSLWSSYYRSGSCVDLRMVADTHGEPVEYSELERSYLEKRALEVWADKMCEER
jgi:hypothetical protein